MKKSVRKTVFTTSIVLMLAVGSNASAIASQVPNPLDGTPLEQLWDIVKEKVSQLAGELTLKLDAALQEISPELADAVGSLIQSQLGELGIVDPQKLKDAISQNAPSDEIGYSAPLLGNEVVRQQTEEAASSVLSKEGQQRSIERIKQAAENAKNVADRLPSINSATNNSADATSNTGDLARQAQQAYLRVQATPIANEILRAIALQQSHIAQQNAQIASQNEQDARQKEEMAKQSIELSKTLSSIDTQLTEAQTQDALQLETTADIAKSIDGQVASQNADRLRVGFSGMKNFIQAGHLY